MYAPANKFFKLVLGAEAVKASDQEPGARHVTVDRQLSGRRRAASDSVDDELRQWTTAINVLRPELGRRHQRRRTLQLTHILTQVITVLHGII